MPTYKNPLEHVKVAAPCPADWEKMVGDERVRYCNKCSLHVYNLSGMSRREAEGLVASAEGRLCVRFYQRPDGTILTQNCPVGLSALKRRATHVATATMTAVLGFFAALGINFGIDRAFSPELMEESAVPAPPIPPVVVTPVAVEVPVEIKGRAIVGKIAPVKVYAEVMGVLAALPPDGQERESEAAPAPQKVQREK